MNDLIEQLAASKTFQGLSISEQKMVLEQMTQADYDHLHLVLKALPTIHAKAQPSAHLKAKLIQRMAIQEQVMPRSHRILPWLKAAAVLFMGVAIGYGFRSDKVQLVEKQVVSHV